MAARKKTTKRSAARGRASADIRVRAVEAKEFRLVDSAGRTRAALEMTGPGPRLVMMHEDGTVALEVMLARQGPSVRLADGAGETRVFIGAMLGTARIGMADANASPRLFVGLGHNGEPSVALYDGSQRRLWATPAAEARSPAKPRQSRAPAK